MEKIIKVSEEIYTDPNVSSPNGSVTPMAYSPNLAEKIQHAYGRHFTFGQPYCVVCLKKEKP